MMNTDRDKVKQDQQSMLDYGDRVGNLLMFGKGVVPFDENDDEE